jgi:hypothetical protein
MHPVHFSALFKSAQPPDIIKSPPFGGDFIILEQRPIIRDILTHLRVIAFRNRRE